MRTILHSEYGDANLDGKVNALDFSALASHFGQDLQGWLTGDFSGDRIVNSADFTMLAQHWAYQYVEAAPIAGGFVPEPSILGVLSIFGCFPLRRRL